MQIFRGLEDWGRESGLRFLSRLVPTPETSAREAGESLRKNPSKVLLIGIYQKMGQFLCATPLIRALDTACPQASFQFLGNSVSAVAARANPHLDRVWVWNKSAPWEWARQVGALRRERFDLTLLLTTERPSGTAVALARAAGVRWLAGYASTAPGDWAKDAGALCHIRIPLTAEKNEVKKYLGLAQAFGIESQGLQPEFVPASSDESAAEEFLQTNQLPKKGLVGLFIGGKAERADRLWPVSHFVRLADALKNAGLQAIAICPPPPTNGTSTYFSDEHLRLDAFRRELSWTCPVFQETQLGRVAAFVKRLDLLVCPDGGMLHLAAAVGTPTLGLFFSTDPDVWRHAGRGTALDGRGKPSSALSPEAVSLEVFKFVGTSARA